MREVLRCVRAPCGIAPQIAIIVRSGPAVDGRAYGRQNAGDERPLARRAGKVGALPARQDSRQCRAAGPEKRTDRDNDGGAVPSGVRSGHGFLFAFLFPRFGLGRPSRSSSSPGCPSLARTHDDHNAYQDDGGHAEDYGPHTRCKREHVRPLRSKAPKTPDRSAPHLTLRTVPIGRTNKPAFVATQFYREIAFFQVFCSAEGRNGLAGPGESCQSHPSVQPVADGPRGRHFWQSQSGREGFSTAFEGSSGLGIALPVGLSGQLTGTGSVCPWCPTSP